MYHHLFPDLNAHQVFTDFQGAGICFSRKGHQTGVSPGTTCEYTASFGLWLAEPFWFSVKQPTTSASDS